ncbi:MAG: OmpL47-type beta-barrel domain-containing protein, partial [Candidatus Pelagibacter ubique]
MINFRLGFINVVVVIGLVLVLFACSFLPRIEDVSTNTNTSVSTNVSTNTNTSASSDNVKPVVVVVNPTNGSVLYTTNVVVSGTASDEGSGVKEVRLSVDGGSFRLVSGTTNWSTNLILSYGNHNMRVYAVDNSNNVSDTNEVNFEIVSIIHVSISNGNDTNDGITPQTPVKSMVRAMEIASGVSFESNVVVKVEVGVYSAGDGLNSSNVGFVINRP